MAGITETKEALRRYRLRLLFAVAVCLFVGVPSKCYRGPGAALVVGDWWDACGSVAVLFCARLVAPRAGHRATVAAIVWALLITDELLQLARADWLTRLRATTIGRVVLGTSFSVLDLAVISCGVVAATFLDAYVVSPDGLTRR